MAPLFIAAQVVGGGVALLLVRALYPDVTARQAAEVVVPHETVGSRS